MKNIFFTVALLVFLFSSCQNKSNKNTGTHFHDDGTEHANHGHESVVTPNQESFEVDIDSLEIVHDTLKNVHQGEHTHKDGRRHTH